MTWLVTLQNRKDNVQYHLFMIQINQPTRCNNFTSLLLDVNVWLNVFRVLLRPSSGAYNCTKSHWFYRWSVVVWPDHDQQCSNHHAPSVEPEAPSPVVRSWWWAEKRPKHVEPHKRQVINLWNCCILLVIWIVWWYTDLRTSKPSI
jgi:hypothetical protein